MTMQLVDRMFHHSDLSRARAMVHDVATKRLEARRKLDELERNAARALADAIRLEAEDFRVKFEKRLEVQSAFLPSILPAGAKPTPFDPWAFTCALASQLKGKPTVKPAQPFPIRALYIEQQPAAQQ